METKYIAVYVDNRLRYLSNIPHDPKDINSLKDLANAENNYDILSDYQDGSYVICAVNIAPIHPPLVKQ